MKATRNRPALAVAVIFSALAVNMLSDLHEHVFGLPADFWAGVLLALTVALSIHTISPLRAPS